MRKSLLIMVGAITALTLLAGPAAAGASNAVDDLPGATSAHLRDVLASDSEPALSSSVECVWGAEAASGAPEVYIEGLGRPAFARDVSATQLTCSRAGTEGLLTSYQMRITILFQYYDGARWTDISDGALCEQTVIITQEPLRCSTQRVFEEDESFVLNRYHRAIVDYSAADWSRRSITPMWFLTSGPSNLLVSSTAQ